MDIEASLFWDYLSIYGLKILGALAILAIGVWASKTLTKIVKKLMKRSNIDDTLISFGGNIVYVLMLGFVIIASLSTLGVETTSLAAVIAAAGLAIGLALQGSLSNFAAGVMIIGFRPFKLGDYVDAAGVSGTVDDISIFTTTLKTPDNKLVIVPNASITSDPITNYSAQETRRIDFVFGIGYDDDIKKAKKVLEKIVTSDERVLKDPAPVIGVKELADSSVNFVVRPWVNTADYWSTYFDITEQVKLQFDKEGISIPFPQQDVHMHNVVPMDGDKKKAA